MSIAQKPLQEYRAKTNYVGNLWHSVVNLTSGYKTEKGCAFHGIFQNHPLTIELENHQDDSQISRLFPRTIKPAYIIADNQQQADELAQTIEQESIKIFLKQAGISQD